MASSSYNSGIQNNDENVIIMVQNEPCLYNITCRDYHDRNAKTNAWNRVASKLNANGELKQLIQYKIYKQLSIQC